MTRITALYASSRFNAGAKRPAKYLGRRLSDLERQRRRPHIIGLDETFAQHMPALRKLLEPEGYAVTRRDEYLIAWDRNVLANRETPVKVRRLSHVYGDGPGRWQDPDLYTRRLKIIETGAGVSVDVVHSPSSVESGNWWRKGDRARAHRDAYQQWGRIIDGRAESVKTFAMHDANLDLRRAVWRDYVDESLGLPGMWSTLKHPATGTHRNWGAPMGRRLIDSINTDARILAGGASPWPGRFVRLDHRAVWITADVPAPLVPVR